MRITHTNPVEGSRSAITVVDPDRRFRALCHACGVPGAIHAHTRKFIPDLSFGDFTILLQVEHRKIRCHHCCKVRVEGSAFVDAGARVTHRLAAYDGQLCEAGLSVEAVARHFDLQPTVRILVVEDEEKVAGRIREGLAAESYQVTVAKAGEDGFFLANSQTVDLVVLDLMLAGRDGLDILARLSARP